MYYVPPSLLPEPVPYPALLGALPTARRNVTVLPYGDPSLRGFDIDFIHLVFARMLDVGWRIEFHTFNTFTELYLGVMAQVCHVAITGCELDPIKSLCPQPVNASAIADYAGVQDYEYGDYGQPGGLPARGPLANGSAINLLSCLSFGAPYFSSGFALMSFVTSTPLDVVGSLFSSDVLNCATVMIIITCAAGFLVFALERGNPHMGTPSRAAYWALFFLLGNSDEDPRNKAGRTVLALYAVCNIVTMSVLTSIIAAKLTTNSLGVTLINGLADVGAGTLCMEMRYNVLNAFVLNNADKPHAVVAASLEQCVDMLVNGTAAAVITDAPTLAWYNSYYQVGAYISPMLQSNLFAFVYSDTDFMRYVNPAVIAATQTDPEWIPFTEALKAKYFGNSNAAPAGGGDTPINYATLAVAVALAGAAFFVAFTNGDVGPGLPFARYRTLLGPSAKADMSDEEAAMVGDEQAATRVLLREIRGLKTALAELRADVYDANPRARERGTARRERAAAQALAAGAAGMTAAKRIEPWALDGEPAVGAAPPPQSTLRVLPPDVSRGAVGASASRGAAMPPAEQASGAAVAVPGSPFCVPWAVQR